MPFLRSLLILLALAAPAVGQDGARDAGDASDAAQALKLYFEALLRFPRAQSRPMRAW
jgi:hypothetical protein